MVVDYTYIRSTIVKKIIIINVVLGAYIDILLSCLRFQLL